MHEALTFGTQEWMQIEAYKGGHFSKLSKWLISKMAYFSMNNEKMVPDEADYTRFGIIIIRGW